MKPLPLALAVTVLLSLSSTTFADDEKPRVLILGDSISMGYTPHVKALLAEDAVVIRPKENCAGTNKGVTKVDEWLKLDGGNWDVVHYNFGLHDLKRVNGETGKNSNDPNDPRQAEPDRYERQLAEITGKLKATGAKLIFATTTPVPAGGVKPHRDVTDPEKYNAIAKKIAKTHGIAIDDLYGFANPRLKDIQRPVNVHFTPAGSKLLAEQVAKSIRESLAK